MRGRGGMHMALVRIRTEDSAIFSVPLGPSIRSVGLFPLSVSPKCAVEMLLSKIAVEKNYCPNIFGQSIYFFNCLGGRILSFHSSAALFAQPCGHPSRQLKSLNTCTSL